jgi:hypothetical protein
LETRAIASIASWLGVVAAWVVVVGVVGVVGVVVVGVVAVVVLGVVGVVVVVEGEVVVGVVGVVGVTGVVVLGVVVLGVVVGVVLALEGTFSTLTRQLPLGTLMYKKKVPVVLMTWLLTIVFKDCPAVAS